MNAKHLLFLSLIPLAFSACTECASVNDTAVVSEWKPVGDKIKTAWAEKINPANVLPEYPRPILERENWLNLNGPWNYAIRPQGTAEPVSFDGQILVPYAVESSLSGVGKMLGKANELWYQRTFTVPSNWKGENVILNFGAVDWKTEVFVNDVKVGGHVGGYAPFSFDITPYLKNSGAQKLVVKVWDPSDEGYQPRGKQVKKPEGIWYTPVSGIWQTVWLEPVNPTHLTGVIATADIDKGTLKVETAVANATAGDIVEITLKDGEKVVSSAKVAAGQTANLSVPAAKLWSPDTPFLYGLDVKIANGTALKDTVKSYAAMRKVSIKKTNDFYRFQLNNKDVFHFGPLDQGWWPDGLYTAPSDEALKYDLIKTKEFGYNMIRKHVKTEPARWYTHCDQLGILVWQDMPNGDAGPIRWDMHKYYDGPDKVRSAESEWNYRNEWKEIIDSLRAYPSIVAWVPFNEAWGQFKTVEIAEWTKNYDPSRLVNPASGGNHYHTGDMLDFHKYPHPEMMMIDTSRVTVLGEYGGIGLPKEGHLWQKDRNWGYVQYKNEKEVTDEYVKYGEMLYELVGKGISGAVYTQTTDVEGEVNGLMTYDRKLIKVEENRLRAINQKIVHSLDK